ncbi:MAG: hypothetical protein ACOX7F_05535 [Eubacteriales bacterium]|jgi:hypothetical protein
MSRGRQIAWLSAVIVFAGVDYLLYWQLGLAWGLNLYLAQGISYLIPAVLRLAVCNWLQHTAEEPETIEIQGESPAMEQVYVVLASLAVGLLTLYVFQGCMQMQPLLSKLLVLCGTLFVDLFGYNIWNDKSQ